MTPTQISIYLFRAAMFVATIGPAYAAGQEQTAPMDNSAAAAPSDMAAYIRDNVPAAIPVSLSAEPGAITAPAAAPAAAPVARPATRIRLTAGDLPAVAAPRQAVAFNAAAPVHQLARDVQTLKAARAALQLNDALSHQQRLVSLR